MKDLAFYLGFAALLTHELDAVARAEWKILPLLSSLPDDVAFPLFVVLHVPLFALLLWLTGNLDHRLRQRTWLGISLFLMIHAGLHKLFEGHEFYQFNSLLSVGLIYGGGLLGLLYVTIVLTQQHQSTENP